jgi:uncharacterized protein
MIERAIHALRCNQQASEFTPLVPECNHKIDGISLGLLGFTEFQTSALFAKFGNGKREFAFTSITRISTSELSEISGEKFSSRISSWVLIEKLIVSHNSKCREDALEYLELEVDPQIFEELSVEEIGLSARSMNVLRRARISTVLQLSQYSREELMNLDNLGISSVNEIERVLVSRGYRRDTEPALNLGALITADLQLEALQLSTRTYNALVREGIRSLSALLKMEPQELSDIRNFGQKSLEEVFLIQEKYGGQLGEIAAAASVEINEEAEDLDWAWKELRAELQIVVRDSDGIENLVVNQFSLDGFDYNTSPMLARYLQEGPITLGDFLVKLTAEISKSKTSFELLSSINFVSIIGRTIANYKSRFSGFLPPEIEKRSIIDFENRYSDDEIDLLQFDSSTLYLLNIHLTEQWAFLGRQTLFNLIELLSTHFITHVGPWEVIRGIREFFARYETFPSVIGLIIGIGKFEGQKRENLAARLEDYFSTARPGFVERDMLIVEMRINGETLDSIGKTVGVTRERVRQIIKKICPIMETTLDYLHNDKNRTISEALENKISALFEEFGAVYRAELAHCLETDELQALSLTPKRFHKFVIDKTTPAVFSSLWTRDDVISLIQKAGTYYFPLRMADYEYLLEIGEIKGPSVQRIMQKFGVWSELCVEAGVEPAPSWKVDYAHLWSEEELISFAERFFMDDGTTGSANGYDDWRTRQTDQVPSGPHIRNQFGTWLEVRRITLESIRKKKGKAIRS